mmetsp:Transcript_20960/g.80745  ORF Transcript_20960/g.80745 Transcript_20960/m.80745 type:complete len:557 (+) Transcript_20960:106-1776(+)
MPERIAGRCDRPDRPARSPPAGRRSRAVPRAVPPLHAGDGRQGLLPRQDPGGTAAPHQVRRHALCARAQLQGEPRRPARPADADLDRPRGRPGQDLEGTQRTRPHHRVREPPAAAQRGPAAPDPRPAARGGRPARGPAGVRPADRRGTQLRLPAHRRTARLRGADAALLLGGQGGHAAAPDPAAQPGGADQRLPAGPAAPARRPPRVPGPRPHAGGRHGRPLPARPARHPAHLPGLPADAGHQGPVGAHAAGAVQRARPDGRRLAARPGQPRHLHRDAAPARGPDPCLPADEPDLGAGPLPVGVPRHRRADAARPLPRLHRGPAHPDGAAQCAALLHPRARPRVPVLLAARRAVRSARAALHRRPLPRRGQGPRRRPLRTRRQRGAPLLPPARPERGRQRTVRLPGRTPPDDVARGAEGRPRRPRGHRRLRRQGGRRPPAHGPLPADRGRHPRHQPQGLERLEGQAARRPLPHHAARPGRSAHQCRRRDRGPQAGGPSGPGAALAAARHRGAAVEDAGRQLFRPARRRRAGLACALAVAPCADPGAGCLRPPLADR